MWQRTQADRSKRQHNQAVGTQATSTHTERPPRMTSSPTASSQASTMPMAAINMTEATRRNLGKAARPGCRSQVAGANKEDDTMAASDGRARVRTDIKRA